MKNLIRIEPIAVKDKNDVVTALTILEKIGIVRMTKEQKISYIEDDKKIIDNNFMIQEDDGGFRIQSHYIGFGISIDSLEKQVDNILKKIPDICEKLKDIEDRTSTLMVECIENDINVFNDSNSISIEIKENIK